MAARLLSAAAAVLFAGLALTLALHYPLGAVAAVGVVSIWGAIVFIQPLVWVIMLPALLPLIGWAPWSGWLTFEELDLLVLSTAAAGYARLAFLPKASPPGRTGKRRGGAGFAAVGWLLALLFASSTLLAVYRGFEDAGGFRFDWFHGYQEAMNSVRVGKSFFLALSLLPLWRSLRDARLKTSWQEVDATVLLAAGMALGLAGAALTTIWERAAFVGLLNFASDYRTTGMFWEMHVGGAALDGYLALTVPFAVHQMLQARKPWHSVAAGGALGLGLYACLTTFSRGVYLAVPVGLAVTLWLHSRLQERHAQLGALEQEGRRAVRAAFRTGLALVALFAVAVAWIFPSSGYRGALALLGAFVVLLPLAQAVPRLRLVGWLGAIGMAVPVAALMGVAFEFAPKTSYLGYGLSFLIGVAALWWQHGLALAAAGKRRVSSNPAALAVASFVCLLLGAAFVFEHWGGRKALLAGLPAIGALLLGLAVLGLARKPLWPAGFRWRAMVSGGMLMTLTVVGVFEGGDYITGRFETGREDMGVRLEHWQQGLGMLDNGQDLQLGKGMGRYPANYLMDGPRAERVGDYRWVSEAGRAHIVLSGGQHPLSDGQLFRFSQRIDLPIGAVALSVDVRAEHDSGLKFEVCPKHLLYTDYACLSNHLEVKAKPGEWQHFDLPLKGSPMLRGDWYAPKLIVFSVAQTTRGGLIDIGALQLRGSDGRALIENPDFSQGMAHWFSSSDHNHLPWHIKSMFLNVVFDQGLLGLLLFFGLTGVALWRASWGDSRDHTLSPSIAGAIAGFFVVGLFDSLLDVPRVAFLFYFLVLLAMNRPRQRLPHRQSPANDPPPETAM